MKFVGIFCILSLLIVGCGKRTYHKPTDERLALGMGLEQVLEIYPSKSTIVSFLNLHDPIEADDFRQTKSWAVSSETRLFVEVNSANKIVSFPVLLPSGIFKAEAFEHTDQSSPTGSSDLE